MNASRLAEIPVVFNRTSGGAELVLEWLRQLGPGEERIPNLDVQIDLLPTD